MGTELQRLKEIVGEALELASPQEREAYVAKACAGDMGLLRKVQHLLEAQERVGNFLETPVGPSEPESIGAAPGMTIGRYKLLEEIGEGGFGRVFAAQQSEPVKRTVALKVIKPGMDTRAVIARFEAERQALALMDHPNIAHVLDAGQTDTGRPYFVMDLVVGVTITHYCDREQLAIPERLRLFMDICRAVQHAHQKGIIHRDLKPTNIIITETSEGAVPKIIDFGIAKALGQKLTEKTLFTAFNQMLGTPAYMSPEQAELTPLDVDTRSDIYSLGVLLYEMLTGVTPLDQETYRKAGLDEIRRLIRETEPLRPSTRLRTLGPKLAEVARLRKTEPATLPRLLHGDLDWVVMKCLEKDRTRRYETADALALDISHHLNSRPVTARPPSTAYRIQKFVRRNKVLVGAASAVAATLLLGIAASLWQAIRATQAEAIARQEAYASDINLAQKALAEYDLGRAKRLLEGHRPRPGEPDLRGWEWRYLWGQCRGEALGEFCRRPGDVSSLSYSPDGKLLALAGLLKTFVEVWDVAARRCLATLQTNTGRVVAFSPRGDLLASDSSQGSAFTGPINLWQAGSLRLLRQLPETNGCFGLSFSPSGSELAVVNTCGGVSVWDVDQGALLRSIGSTNRDVAYWIALTFSPDGKRLAIGGVDGTLRMVSLETGATLWDIPAHPEERLTAVVWSKVQPLIATGSGFEGGPLRLWDADSGNLVGELEGQIGMVSGLIFSADGKSLYSSAGDQTIRIWDVAQRRCAGILRKSSDELYGLALSPDGKTLVSAGKDGIVALWSTVPVSNELQPKLLVSEEKSRVPIAGFDPSGESLAFVRGGIVTLHQLPSLQERGAIPGLGTNVCSVTYSADGKFIATGSTDGSLRVWSRRERRMLKEQVAHTHPVAQLRFSADGTRLLSCGEPDMSIGIRGELTVWDTRTWEPVWSCSSNNVEFLAISADGRLVVEAHGTRSFKDELGWWDTKSGKRVWVTNTPISLHSAAFSPQGRHLATSAYDGTVTVWDTHTFQKRVTFKAHLNAVSDLTFSADGRRLITGGETGRDAAKVWDFATCRELLTLTARGGYFAFTAFSPDGNYVAAGSFGRGLFLWQAPSWAEIEAAEKASGQAP